MRTNVQLYARIECVSQILLLVRTVRIRMWNIGVSGLYSATFHLHYSLRNGVCQSGQPGYLPLYSNTGAIDRSSFHHRAGT